MSRIAAALRKLGSAPLSYDQAKQIASEVGIHPNSVYRYRARLMRSGELSAVGGRKRGWTTTKSRLSDAQEQVIQDAIKAIRKKPSPVRMVDVVEEVDARSRLAGIPCPSRPAIDLRVTQVSGSLVVRRGKARPGNADPTISPGTYRIRKPLDVVQIDHTTMDIVVVDDLYRQPIGHPYLTLATDVATRSVLGFVMTFIPPCASTVSLCLTMVISRKEPWLKELGISELPWPMFGLPKALHLDRAAEFRSKALRRGCGEYGIDLLYRKRPHHGGHIERLLGTKMSKLKALPGATGGSPKSRREFNPDKHAALTLGELEIWFARQIVGRYHLEPHRGLTGGTPIGAWESHPTPSLPPDSVRRFRIAFLPAITRKLRREGLTFHHLRYWHPIFAQWLGIRDTLLFHFNPRDLSTIYIPINKDYLEVRFSDLTMPAVSLWEAVAASKHLRKVGQRRINPGMIAESIEDQRLLVANAQEKTKKARRDRNAPANKGSHAIDPLVSTPTSEEDSEIDWTKPVEAYPGEIW